MLNKLLNLKTFCILFPQKVTIGIIRNTFECSYKKAHNIKEKLESLHFISVNNKKIELLQNIICLTFIDKFNSTFEKIEDDLIQIFYKNFISTFNHNANKYLELIFLHKNEIINDFNETINNPLLYKQLIHNQILSAPLKISLQEDFSIKINNLKLVSNYHLNDKFFINDLHEDCSKILAIIIQTIFYRILLKIFINENLFSSETNITIAFETAPHIIEYLYTIKLLKDITKANFIITNNTDFNLVN